jgi:hypothetical protein
MSDYEPLKSFTRINWDGRQTKEKKLGLAVTLKSSSALPSLPLPQ